MRLILGGLGVAAALLVIVPAPTSALWKLTILVTEWGYVLTPVALLPFWPGWRQTWFGRIGAMLGLTAACLFVSPLLRAIPIALHLPEKIADAFDQTALSPANPSLYRSAPLAMAELLRGVHSSEVSVLSQIYVTRDEYEGTLDLYYPPQQKKPAPGVVVIHGGSWNSGDAQQLTALNYYLATRGYVVAAINYRLAPKWPFPAALEDVQAAITFLRENAVSLSLDAERLVLLGRSAGGQLALLAGYTTERTSIRGVVAFYSPADLLYSYDNPANPSVIDTRTILNDYLNGVPTQIRETYLAASPIQFVSITSPPTLLVHGERDELVSATHSERLDQKLSDKGVPHLYLRFPWATHGCDAMFNGPCGQLSTYTIEQFLRTVLHVDFS